MSDLLILAIYFTGVGVGLLIGWCIWRRPSLDYKE